MDNFISVIVPVYNGSEYIDDFIHSFLNQDSDNFELVLVDDGSKDNSLDLIERYHERYDFIKTYHIENSGVSVARNYGLAQAVGSIITFVDVDDKVSKNFISFIEKNITNYDIILFDAYICKNDSRPVINKLFEYSGDFSTNSKKERLIAQCISYRFGSGYKPRYHGVGAIWGKAFKSDILKEIEFVQGLRMSEDAVYVIEAIHSANSIYYYNVPLYYYRANNLSASRSYDNNYLETNTLMYKSFKDVLGKYNLLRSENIYKAFQHRMFSNIINILRNFVFSEKNAGNNRGLFEKSRQVDWIDNALSNYDKGVLSKSDANIVTGFSDNKYVKLKIYFNFEYQLKHIKRLLMIYFARRQNG